MMIQPPDLQQDLLACSRKTRQWVLSLCGSAEVLRKQANSLMKENEALRKEVNGLRAQLGMGRKYVEWGDKPKGGCPVSGG